ncbi:MAG: hypothetical protein N4A61_10095 [Pelagimonas sp.]|nr:hypothetical protein [Pelagimonas sp.]
MNKLTAAMVFLCCGLAGSIQAQSVNPLETIYQDVLHDAGACLQTKAPPRACFETVIMTCQERVRGFAHNSYPCSTNTRLAFMDLAESRLALKFPGTAASEHFQTALRSGWRLCGQLRDLAADLNGGRLSLADENCLNGVAVLVLEEMWQVLGD